jgi:hypothetical protein
LITEASTYALEVSTNLDSTFVMTSTITVVPDEPSAEDSTVDFVGTVTLDVSQTVEVDIYDAYGNRVIVEQPILLVVEGQG